MFNQSVTISKEATSILAFDETDRDSSTFCQLKDIHIAILKSVNSIQGSFVSQPLQTAEITEEETIRSVLMNIPAGHLSPPDKTVPYSQDQPWRSSATSSTSRRRFALF
jgi:hypothetical protein